MARPTQKRRRRTQPDARREPRRVTVQQPTVEQAMFFPRLRRQAKWMFVFLALVFGVGFVVFGVGSNAPSGLGDVLNFGGVVSDEPSVSEAREKVRENPRNAAAQLELVDALQRENKTDQAITALERYVELRPRDTDAVRRLAALYYDRASVLRERVEQVQFEAAPYFAGGVFAASQPFGEGPIAEALSERASTRINDVGTRMRTAFEKAKATYERLAALAPNDPSVQLQLADVAYYAGDTQTAIRAYKRFLRIAPEDDLAPSVRQQIRQLESASALPAPG